MPGEIAEIVSGAIGGVANLGLGVANFFRQSKADDQNYAAQKANLAWQKEAQGITWGREDNAIQRRVSDLRAAGLSPTLAAGSAAAASAPIQTTAPHREVHDLNVDPVGAYMAAIQMQKTFANMDAQNQLLQSEKAYKDNEVLESAARFNSLTLANQRAAYENGLMRTRFLMEAQQHVKGLTNIDKQLELIASQITSNDASARAADAKLQETLHNLNIAKQAGVPTDAPPAVKTASSALSAAKQLWDKYGKTYFPKPPVRTPEQKDRYDQKVREGFKYIDRR